MKMDKKVLLTITAGFFTLFSMAQDQKQSETKELNPVKVNEVVQSKKTNSKHQGKKLRPVQHIQKVGKEEKE